MNPRSFIISVLMHLGVVLLAVVGLPSLNRPLPEDQPLVTIEMVRTVPETNLNKGGEVNSARKEQQAVERKISTPPPPKSKPDTPKNLPKSVSKEMRAVPEIITSTIRKKPKPVAPSPPKFKSQKASTNHLPTKLPKQAPKRVNKMARKNNLAKKRSDAMDGVMQNLANAKALNEDAKKKRRAKERKIAAEKLNKSVSVAIGDVLKAPKKPFVGPLGLSDIDRLRAHLANCWNPPIGALGSDALIVDIIMSLDRDGSVLSAKVDNRLRFNTDKIFKVAAEEAIRATRKCSPFPLPPEKYSQWKSFVFVFDPRFLSR